MTWKSALADRMPGELAVEIDTFERQIDLRRQGKIDEKVFAETRLRRGVYGQRYDNGQRNDGTGAKRLPYPSNGLTKGPETVWDAPGMQRIKIPFGGLTPAQMDTLADLAEEYSDGICHITTRQDVQLHFVHIEDTPDLMRRLAAVGITTREACGNTVRNVTACPLAGVCRDETFDVTPYAKACMRFLLGHPDAQDFGRKFKVAFSGCREHACGLVSMHDLGLIAVTRTVDGCVERGFETYVGGGLGAVPHQAKLFDPFLPVTELLPLAQAIARVFARLGEKRNRARARIKFLVAQLGLEEFKRLVLEERASLQPDGRWDAHVASAADEGETAFRPSAPLDGAAEDGGNGGAGRFDAWARTNVYEQRQANYATATVSLPLGDLTSRQLRGLASVARRYVGDAVRTTVEQNIVLRWVSAADLPAFHRDLAALGLADPGAGTIADITACPGTDTCKLGIASSRGLAAELRSRLSAAAAAPDPAVERFAHQDERLLQLVRPAPRRGPRFLWREPDGRRLHGAALPGRARRPVGGERRLLRAGVRGDPVEADPRGGRPHHGPLRRRAAGVRVVPGFHAAHRQARAQGDARRPGAGARPATTAPAGEASTRTGEIRASSPSATWGSASARARWSR